MITVLGATGNTGSEIARLLLDRGHKVRAVGRSQDKLDELGSAGAEIHAGDMGDAAFLTDALRGADAAYSLIPFNPQWTDFFAETERLGTATVTALREARVGHVVALSSVGADRPAGTGFITSLYQQERRLGELDANVLALRPGAFFENFYAALAAIQQLEYYGDSVSPDARIPMIATRDIAAVAADALARRDWEGFRTRELLGPRDLSYAEATRLLGQQLGKPDLEYVRIPEDEMRTILTSSGFSAGSAALQIEMNRAFSDGTVSARESRDSRDPGVVLTRFEDFAAELVQSSAGP